MSVKDMSTRVGMTHFWNIFIQRASTECGGHVGHHLRESIEPSSLGWDNYSRDAMGPSKTTLYDELVRLLREPDDKGTAPAPTMDQKALTEWVAGAASANDVHHIVPHGGERGALAAPLPRMSHDALPKFATPSHPLYLGAVRCQRSRPAGSRAPPKHTSWSSEQCAGPCTNGCIGDLRQHMTPLVRRGREVPRGRAALAPILMRQ